MSRTSLVLTVLGQDRPGLVGQLAQLVTEHGGNWIESRMAHLAGQFAGILRVEIESESASALTDAIKGLNEYGLETVIQPDVATAAVVQTPLIELSLVGQDRPGIVSEISNILAAHGVNVEELTTECCNAPNSGQALFRAAAQLRLPSGLTTEELRKALEHVAQDLMVEFALD